MPPFLWSIQDPKSPLCNQFASRFTSCPGFKIDISNYTDILLEQGGAEYLPILKAYYGSCAGEAVIIQSTCLRSLRHRVVGILFPLRVPLLWRFSKCNSERLLPPSFRAGPLFSLQNEWMRIRSEHLYLALLHVCACLCLRLCVYPQVTRVRRTCATMEFGLLRTASALPLPLANPSLLNAVVPLSKPCDNAVHYELHCRKELCILFKVFLLCPLLTGMSAPAPFFPPARCGLPVLTVCQKFCQDLFLCVYLLQVTCGPTD